jgi:hypothetical protein
MDIPSGGLWRNDVIVEGIPIGHYPEPSALPLQAVPQFVLQSRPICLPAKNSKFLCYGFPAENEKMHRGNRSAAFGREFNGTCPRSPPKPLSAGFFGSDQSTIFKRDSPLLLLAFPVMQHS